MSSHLTRFLALAFLACTCAIGQTRLAPDKQTTSAVDNQASPIPAKPQIADLEKRPKMSESTRMLLIQAINAEFARTRKTFPVGYKDITLTTEGKLKPEDGRLYQLAMTYGAA